MLLRTNVPFHKFQLRVERYIANQLDRASMGLRPLATVVSAIPHELYPADPAITRAIRGFDPYFMPVFVKKVYKAQTGGLVYHLRHAWAQWAPNPGEKAPIERWVYRTLTPTHGRTHRPTSIQLHLYHRQENGRQIPGTFVPYDWQMYYWFCEMATQLAEDERRKLLAAQETAARLAREAVEAQDEAECKADWPWLRKKIESFDSTDWKRVAARGLNTAPPGLYVGKARKKVKTSSTSAPKETVA